MSEFFKDLASILAIIMGVSIVGAEDTPFLLGLLGTALLIYGLDYRYFSRFD